MKQDGAPNSSPTSSVLYLVVMIRYWNSCTSTSTSRHEIIILVCWLHVYIKFYYTGKAISPAAANNARQGLKLIRNQYRLVHQGKIKPPDGRRRYRQAVVKPHLEKLLTWITENQACVLSYDGLLATPFTYIQNQWLKLSVILQYGRLKLVNKKVVCHSRLIATVKKVWLFAKSVAGASHGNFLPTVESARLTEWWLTGIPGCFSKRNYLL